MAKRRLTLNAYEKKVLSASSGKQKKLEARIAALQKQIAQLKAEELGHIERKTSSK